MLLLEVFNSPYGFTCNSGGNRICKFKTDLGHTIIVTFVNRKKISGEGVEGEYHVSFARSSDKHPSGSTDITGDGDAYRIFATVMSIMVRFIEEVSPDVIRFSASKLHDEGNRGWKEVESRVKLYDRMIKTFAIKYGYSLSPWTEDDGEEKFYVLEKNDS